MLTGPALSGAEHAQSLEDAPADLASACRWAARRRIEIDALSKSENWSDETCNAECEKINAVFVRAIEEPSRNAADVSAKAALALEDFERFIFPGPFPEDEPKGNDGERIVRTVLRETAALQAGDDEPATIEFLAGVDFEAYRFDDVPRSGNDWVSEFAPHAVGLAMAEKLLRMTKPQTIAFMQEADTDGVFEALTKTLVATSETLKGWSQLVDLTHSRLMVGGAVLAMAQNAGTSAATEA